MNKSYSSLYEMEMDRQSENKALITYINDNNEIVEGLFPIIGANIFFHGNNGSFGLTHIIDDANDVLSLFTETGTTITDEFVLDHPYHSLIVKENTVLIINKDVVLCKKTVVHGQLRISAGCKLEIKNEAEMIFYSDSKLIIENGASIFVHGGANVKIYGTVELNSEYVSILMNDPFIELDSIAILNVTDIENTGREFSVTDYEKELRGKRINIHTQGAHNTGISEIGYTWRDGDVLLGSQVIDISILWGKAILGDYKFQVLGERLSGKNIPNRQIIRNLTIEKDSTLYISSNPQDQSLEGNEYYHPELYVGVIIDNTEKPGMCTVEGKLVVDSPDAMITIDRGGKLFIKEGAIVDLSNGATMRLTYTSYVDEETHEEKYEKVLIIHGTLIIDRLEQLQVESFDNISFQDDDGNILGKLIIRNKYPEGKLLFETPNGIQNSELYRIFTNGDDISKLECIEYHIPSNCGIKIDKYYEYYSAEMVNWYANRRLEKAIYDGLIVWEGGYIELNSEIIPWVDSTCTLYEASSIFKNSSANKKDRLQEVAEHFIYANSGNIIFRFIDGGYSRDITLHLERPTIKSGASTGENGYQILYSNTGFLYMKNNIANADKRTLISSDSVMYQLDGVQKDILIPPQE